MTILYFSSTGNCLAVAKKLGGTLISIPQVIDTENLHFEDDVFGLIFPIYGFSTPKMVRRFLEKATWKADYAFAIGTYGNLPGAAMMNVQQFVKSRGQIFDYTASLLMVDNYLPGFNIQNQVKNLPFKHVEENLNRILADIQNRKKAESETGLGWRLITNVIQYGANYMLNGSQGKHYLINQNCNQCGICAKVCPAANIEVNDKVVFLNQCEACLGCVHLCPQNAIHLKNEKTATRWRNPEVSLKEMIEANNRQKEIQ